MKTIVALYDAQLRFNKAEIVSKSEYRFSIRVCLVVVVPSFIRCVPGSVCHVIRLAGHYQAYLIESHFDNLASSGWGEVLCRVLSAVPYKTTGGEVIMQRTLMV